MLPDQHGGRTVRRMLKLPSLDHHRTDRATYSTLLALARIGRDVSVREVHGSDCSFTGVRKHRVWICLYLRVECPAAL